MSKIERYFDRLMNEYYSVLINAWDESVKSAAREAIKELVKLDDDQRADEKFLKDLEYNIKQRLSVDFANKLDSKVKVFAEISYKIAAQEDQFKNVKISFGPADSKNIDLIKQQQVFWLKEHYGGSTSEKLQAILQTSIGENWNTIKLAEKLKGNFGEMVKQSDVYFQGLAEHTGLRVREFGRLNNYKRLGVTHYKIIAVIDERTSEICRYLNGKIFPVTPALQKMDAMFEVHDDETVNETKDRLKRLAPFVKDKDIPALSSGEMELESLFPPFHWRCRSRTVMV